MIYDELTKTYKNGEPIFLDDFKNVSKNYLRQEMKRLVDNGKLKRFFNGVYYLPFKTILGTEGTISSSLYLEKKYLNNDNGYVTGLQLANRYGFTSQNPSFLEICSNSATTAQRKYNLTQFKYILYKPLVRITKQNKSALQFLDLMTDLDKYSEITYDELVKKVRSFVDEIKVDFSEVKKVISLYPDKVYKNIYIGGVMNELV